MKQNWFPAGLLIVIVIVGAGKCMSLGADKKEMEKRMSRYAREQVVDTVWRGWGKYQIPLATDSGRLIWYGHELIANTSYYLGPRGIKMQTTNGMNCQNCHLDGGTIPYGNNFGRVYATYPQYRPRNNGIQTIYHRINDCLERSLNGKAMDSNRLEMRAIYAYFKWLGEDVPKGVARGGTGLKRPPYLNRAADPARGEQVYIAQCRSCHGTEGQGVMNMEGTGYSYPPLWGPHSYNDGAGLYRLGNFAAFVKNNMPFGVDYHSTQLTDEQAWDVAAFVNSRKRPHKDQSADWADLSRKPVDFSFGPYVDTFSENQHKYGPYQPILLYMEQYKNKNKKSTK